MLIRKKHYTHAPAGDLNPKVGQWVPGEWRRGFFVLVSVFTALGCATIIVCSYSLKFRASLFEFVIAIKLFSYAVEGFLLEVTQDALIITPLSLTLVLMQFMICMAGETFLEFVGAFYLQFFVSVMAGVHLTDLTNSLRQRARKFVRWVKFSLNIEEPDSAKDIMEEMANATSLEPLVWIMQSYAMSFLVLVSAPMMLIFISYYNQVLRIDKFYEIDERNEWMYLLFIGMVILPHVVLDIILLNVQELFHGHRVYEYISYTKFRFNTRRVRWQLFADAMDRGVARQFRALDLVAFSSQFYFATLVHAIGVFSFVMGLVIVVAQDFNPFGDPVLPLIVALLWAVCTFVKFGTLRLGNILNIWQVPLVRKRDMVHVRQNDPTVPVWDKKYKATVDLTIDKKYITNEVVQMEHFRHSFVKHNRPWIVQQLKDLLRHDILLRHRTVYKNVLEFMSKMLMMDDPGSSDSDDTEYEVNLFGISKDIAMMWIIQARRRVYLRKLAKPVIDSMLAPNCVMCGARNRTLRVWFAQPVTKIINIYEMANMKKVLVKEHWQAYLRNTSVTHHTLCLSCSRKADQIRLFVVNKTAVRIAEAWVSILRNKKAEQKRRRARDGAAQMEVSSDSESSDPEGKQDGVPKLIHMHTKAILDAWHKIVTDAPIEEDKTSTDDESSSDYDVQ